ncbi:hypothetical protein B7Z28_00375, partial [Candidatus Saccharibacteria bacterium 32-45-3]
GSMKVDKEYPSAVGVGYVKVIPSGDLASFEEQVRGEGFLDFSVYPKEPGRDVYTAITYLEPFNAANQKAFGYDMFSEEFRREAMEKARDSGEAAMTRPVKLIQDKDVASSELGTLIYYPIYASGDLPTEVDERRETLIGYTYVILRPADIMTRYLKRLSPEASLTDITVFDIANPDRVLYTHDGSNAEDQIKEVGQKSFLVAGHEWLISISAAQSFTRRVLAPLATIAIGGIASLLLAVAVVVGISGRFRKVELSYRKEVQRTKDELLALSSHQLRTPASGVKQYIGMLAEGLVGPLTPLQEEIAQKAYEANERQLHIINELLYVSKADAGQLLIEPTEMNLTPFVARIVEDFADQAAKKEIRIEFSEKNDHTVVADDRYVGMIIENLVSNAIKYSYAKATVTVTMGETSSMCFVAVRDEGVGIAKKDFSRVFTKFDRIENPLSHSETGSGLGLFLAQQLAKGHGGEIKLTSVPKKGSTFTLYLPKQSSMTPVAVRIDGKENKFKRDMQIK